jgi:DNA-binding NarL/FixJ family response regulator
VTRVLIVDDHPVFRDGLAGLLTTLPGVEVTGTAATAEEALTAISETAPDVILMDINLPGASGVEAARRASQIAPAAAVLVITMVDDDDTVFAALAAGARGYVLKGASADEIAAALRTAAAGGAVFGAGIASRLLARTPGRSSGPASPYQPDELTTREREILDLLAEGASNQQIARSLGISLKTRKTTSPASSTSSRPPTVPRPPSAPGAFHPNHGAEHTPTLPQPPAICVDAGSRAVGRRAHNRMI